MRKFSEYKIRENIGKNSNNKHLGKKLLQI